MSEMRKHSTAETVGYLVGLLLCCGLATLAWLLFVYFTAMAARKGWEG